MIREWDGPYGWNYFNLLAERIGMSNGKSKNNRRGMPQFVSASIPIDDMDSAIEYAPTLDVGLSRLMEIVSEGGNVSLKKRDDDELFQSSVTVKGSDGGNYILTARASTIEHAVNGVLYKYHVICGGDLPAYASASTQGNAIQ